MTPRMSKAAWVRISRHFLSSSGLAQTPAGCKSKIKDLDKSSSPSSALVKRYWWSNLISLVTMVFNLSSVTLIPILSSGERWTSEPGSPSVDGVGSEKRGGFDFYLNW